MVTSTAGDFPADEIAPLLENGTVDGSESGLSALDRQQRVFAFVRDMASTVGPSYIPMIEKHKNTRWYQRRKRVNQLPV